MAPAEPLAGADGARHGLLQKAKAHLRTRWFWGSLAACLVAFIVMISLQVDLQWFWILAYAAVIVPFCPWVSEPLAFYRGGLGDDAKGAGNLLLLAASVSISWVFAKSILNASTLGAKYGVVGGLAYAGYYTSFFSVGVVIYFMRTRKGIRSLPEAISDRYGSLAAVAFGCAVFYRLFQEVWSNALVVGSFYGPFHSTNWWLGACLSTAVPVIYSFTGGMRASIVTDGVQVVGCVGFLVALLIVLGINAPANFGDWNGAGSCSLAGLTQPITSPGQCAVATHAPLLASGAVNPIKQPFTFANGTCSYPTISNATLCTAVGASYKQPACKITNQPACTQAGGAWTPRTQWSLAGGLDLFIVACLQGLLSYPFFDPVLTDRAFLAAPKTMLGAFGLGGVVAGLFIFLFSFFGIFGNMQAILDPNSVPDAIYKDMLSGQPSAVSRFFGTAVYSIVNIIFITESLSTLDSTFTSAAKLFGPEFFGLVQDGQPRPPQAATKRHLLMGRIVILLLAVVGILPLLASPTALDATTVSGTVVMGLGPPIYALMFLDGYHPLTFHLPFWWGVGMGIVFQLSTSDCCKHSINVTGFNFGTGSYANLLGFNVIGAAGAWGLMLLTLLENPFGSRLARETRDGNNFVQKARALAGMRHEALPTALVEGGDEQGDLPIKKVDNALYVREGDASRAAEMKDAADTDLHARV